ncbi:MAG: UDP-3-O-(3-hydroxymyristoyl)glucosamine N-acyltransferase [Burkholderiales bacterium]|nr:UDP-3-O-(3-hydroxymyristoyl)glucosamine N-acyltransferase [Burkholderiales bacterium]
MLASVTLGEIAARLGGELIGEVSTRIDAVGPLDSATPSTIAFLANPLYEKQLAGSHAGCVIVAPAFRDAALARGAAIVTPDPYLYFARLTQWWAARTRPAPAPGVHASAVVDPAARVAADASIGAFVVVEAGASIGAGVVVGAHGFVGRDCSLGAGTRLAPRVTLMFETTLGERCFVQSGAVLGGDGFGFAPTAGRWEKIEQLGRVRIGDDVEIGANSCIDRGAAGDTLIGDGVKIDNLVQIGHNVRIGAHTAIAGCVGIAGSATIGAHCMIGGGVGINGHVSIADRVVITGATQVTRSIAKAGVYSGLFPFDDNASWEKNAATLRNLHALRERVRALEKKQS